MLYAVLISCVSVQSQSLVKISPDKEQQTVEGWGSSLCWWAHMLGQWQNEEAIDEIVNYITSPNELNMNVFRYNIGGGDNPAHYSTENTPGHMAFGKGLRAEMQGFKASETSPYDWSADAGQRKIMLKIKEKRPDAVFEAFSNSAPYWMTYSGCSAGNENALHDNLNRKYYNQFCDYLIDVCKFYKDSLHIEFKTLEPFNEPLTGYWNNLGSQEGCHFSVKSQIKLLKILYPKLKKSHLATVISVCDETNLSLFITELEEYIADGNVVDLLGQLNTHTYNGSDKERKKVSQLVRRLDKPFWQSETGPSDYSSTDLGTNLQLAQKLIADMRILKPTAWLDWQMMEENNNTWCFFRADFKNETYHLVKNFYVRMQFTRFIKQGYHIIESDNSDVLAALNPQKTELVLVAVNNSDSQKNFQFDLSAFRTLANSAELYSTNENGNCKKQSQLNVENKRINYQSPGRSISTIVLPAKQYE